jgi:hypothetical protein
MKFRVRAAQRVRMKNQRRRTMMAREHLVYAGARRRPVSAGRRTSVA